MSKSRPVEEILSAWDVFERPKEGQHFVHYKGGEYEIVTTGILEDSESPCVVYRSLERGTVWVRTAKNFLEEVEHDGNMMPRFKPLQS